MPEDDYEARVAEKIALIRQQEAARQKADRPEPTLKPTHARGFKKLHEPKNEKQIVKEANQLVKQEDQEAQARKAELKGLNLWDAKRANEAQKDFNKSDDPEMSKPKKSAKEQMAERAARIEKNPQAKKNRAGMQEQDQQSRFFERDWDR